MPNNISRYLHSFACFQVGHYKLEPAIGACFGGFVEYLEVYTAAVLIDVFDACAYGECFAKGERAFKVDTYSFYHPAVAFR